MSGPDGAAASEAAREKIMARLRKRMPADAAARTAGAQARLAGGARGLAPVPAQARAEGAARQALFEEKLRKVDGTLTRLASMADLPAALAQELRARNLPRAIRMGHEPDFEGLDWQGTEVTRGPGRLEEPAALSRAVAGVAETGTLVLTSGPENPVTLTFLAETHFAVLRASEVAAGLEQVWEGLRRAGAASSRTVNFVTGPSRSADIGQTLQLGAHGPVALHVFLIED